MRDHSCLLARNDWHLLTYKIVKFPCAMLMPKNEPQSLVCTRSRRLIVNELAYRLVKVIAKSFQSMWYTLHYTTINFGVVCFWKFLAWEVQLQQNQLIPFLLRQCSFQMCFPGF